MDTDLDRWIEHAELVHERHERGEEYERGQAAEHERRMRWHKLARLEAAFEVAKLKKERDKSLATLTEGIT